MEQAGFVLSGCFLQLRACDGILVNHFILVKFCHLEPVHDFNPLTRTLFPPLHESQPMIIQKTYFLSNLFHVNSPSHGSFLFNTNPFSVN